MFAYRQVALLSLFALSLQQPAAALETAAGSNPARATGQRVITPAVSQAHKQFDRLVDEYFAASFKFNPNFATVSGIHDLDNQLNTMSPERVRERINELKTFKRRLSLLSPLKLPVAAQIDRLMLISDANAQLLELENIKSWKRNPDFYSSKASENIFSLIKRNFASPESRLKAVIAREQAIPELLSNAAGNLESTPKIYTEVALEQLPGIISFFQNQVPAAFENVSDKALLDEFTRSNAGVIAALRDYQDYLKAEVLPSAVADFAIGKDAYQQKLLHEEMITDDTEQLLTQGTAELKRLQAEFVATAKKIDPNKPAREVFASLAANHPHPDQLLNSVSALLNDLRQRSSTIVTIPAEAQLKVQETPPFMRATTFASMDTPGPFETSETEAFYQVTLPEKDWDQNRTEEHMRAYCAKDLINTSVHEAFPGHFVQGLWMKQAPSKTRKLLWCGSNSEGWAHYCEQIMAEQAGDDHELRLVQLHDALLRAARYIVGIRLHTQGMTIEQAKQFFVEEGYQEQANAEREAKRGTMDPTYLVYTLGKLQILELRDAYQKASGDKYSIKEFHDRFLAEGCAPVALIRKALLSQVAGSRTN